MLRRVLLAAAVAACLAAPAGAFAQTTREASQATPARNAATRALYALFDAEWERGMRENPEEATYRGDKRYNDRWTDMSMAAIQSRMEGDRNALQQARAIDRSALSASDQLHYDVFVWDLEKAVERQKYREYLRPVSQRGGVQNAEGIAELLPFASTKDYRDWLARMRSLPTVIEQTQALMREGAAAGNTPPRVLMQRIPAQVQSQIVEDPTASPFYKPFAKFPDSVPEADRAALQAQAKDIISGQLVPAYSRFLAFFNDEYLPETRESIAAVDLPDGKAYYDFVARYFTTTDLTAEQIHQIGLKEVARIRAEMEKVKAEVGFKGTLAEFFEYLRTDPKFFYKTPEELFTAYEAISKRIDPAAGEGVQDHSAPAVRRARRFPTTSPRTPPPPTTSPAPWTAPAPGYYYVNLYKPEVRPKWEMMAAVVARGRAGTPFPVRPRAWNCRTCRCSAVSAISWPTAKAGACTPSAWATTWVCTTTRTTAWASWPTTCGARSGWSWTPACTARVGAATRRSRSSWTTRPRPDQDVVNEIDRYIGWPGQALAYKIGQLKISELREKAAKQLGPKFDLREFNDAVLETGSVPLQALEARIDAWVGRRAGEP